MARPEQREEEGHVEKLDPKLLANLKNGADSAAGTWGDVQVSNEGLTCHIQLKAVWDLPPECIFAIFSHPDNSSLFRDVKMVGARNVVKTGPNYKEVEVEQRGELRVLWIARQFATWLHVVEDARNSECLRTTFDLMRSDVLAGFHGEWEMRPVYQPGSSQAGTHAVLKQQVLPKGIPSFLKHIPLMDSLLRSVTMRTIRRLMEDIDAAVAKIKAGVAQGQRWEEALRRLCGSASEVGHANGHVASFAMDYEEDSGDDSGEGDGGCEEGQQHREGEQQPQGLQVRPSQQHAGADEGAPAAGGLEQQPPLTEEQLRS